MPGFGELKNRTPIMEAAYYGNKKIIELLLKYKADPNAQDDQGHTALYEALEGVGDLDISIINLLISHGAKGNELIEQSVINSVGNSFTNSVLHDVTTLLIKSFFPHLNPQAIMQEKTNTWMQQNQDCILQ